jgi:hypothetical protein
MLCACLLAACAKPAPPPPPKPLTRVECHAIQNKETAILVHSLPPGDYPAVRELTKDANARNLRACYAGKRYDRADLECITAAQSSFDVSACEAKSRR